MIHHQTTCDGLVNIPTDDGPEPAACLGCAADPRTPARRAADLVAVFASTSADDEDAW